MATFVHLCQFSSVEQLGPGVPAGYKEGSVMWKKTPSGDSGRFLPPSFTAPLISSQPIKSECAVRTASENV